MNTQLSALRQQLAELAEQHRSGALEADAYEHAKAALEGRIVAAVMQSATSGDAVTRRPGIVLMAGLAAIVFVAAFAGLMWLGASRDGAAGPQASSPSAALGMPAASTISSDAAAGHAVDSAQISAMIDRLAARLQKQPDDADGWAMLARSYAVTGRHAEAVPAFEKAGQLRKDDPVLLADYADALAVVHGGRLEGEPMTLVQRALGLDPNNVKALSLAGSAAFERKDFAGAVGHWETLLRVAPADSPFVKKVKDGIAQARARSGSNLGASAPGAAGISGTVRLASSVASKAAPEDTVFVFAQAAEGSRIPLALLRKQVKDLPFSFRLDDSMAMSPDARLSAHKKLVVGARVSKSGDALARPGDLLGQSKAVAHGAQGLNIEISEILGR